MIYETSEDLKREVDFMNKIEKHFNCLCHKLPMHWYVDCICSRNKQGVAIAELKTRNVTFGQYDSLICNKKKLEKGLRLGFHFGLPLMLFVRLLDRDVYTKVKTVLGLKSSMVHAKNHFEDLRDIKEHVFIPNEKFREF